MEKEVKLKLSLSLCKANTGGIASPETLPIHLQHFANFSLVNFRAFFLLTFTGLQCLLPSHAQKEITSQTD